METIGTIQVSLLNPSEDISRCAGDTAKKTTDNDVCVSQEIEDLENELFSELVSLKEKYLREKRNRKAVCKILQKAEGINREVKLQLHESLKCNSNYIDEITKLRSKITELQGTIANYVRVNKQKGPVPCGYIRPQLMQYRYEGIHGHNDRSASQTPVITTKFRRHSHQGGYKGESLPYPKRRLAFGASDVKRVKYQPHTKEEGSSSANNTDCTLVGDELHLAMERLSLSSTCSDVTSEGHVNTSTSKI